MIGFDWKLALTVNGGALMRVVVGLFAMLPGEDVATVTRRVHLTILGILRPAESAVRRLIAVEAEGVVVPPVGSKSVPTGPIPSGSGKTVPCFPLFDTRRCVDPKETRVPGRGPGVWGFDGRYSVQMLRDPSPDDPVDARRLVARMKALRAALDDLPRHGKRLARILARGRSKWRRVMRPGRPPGHRHKGTRVIDTLLAECQRLALMRLQPPDP